MKSKAKRNNNRPVSFQEKCRNAFGGALKGLAGVNAAKKEDMIASFDLDKRSVERRIDAMEKNRAVAKRIAEDCIKGGISFDFDDEWIAINIIMAPPYNVGEKMFNYSLAASIWILDAIRANNKMDEALALLPKDKDKLDSVRLPKCVSPCYSEAVLRSMVYTILHRNEDCVGLVKSPKDPAKVFVTDGYTIAGKQNQDVPSRRVFEGILALLPEEVVDNAVNMFAVMSKLAVSRYFTCRNKWIKKENKYTEEIRKKTEELKAISEESIKLSEKAEAAFTGKSIQQRIEGVPLIDDKMQVAADVFDLKNRSDDIIDEMEEIQDERDALYGEILDFQNDSIIKSYWTEESWAKRYPKLIARCAARYSVPDPYEMCFAFYYLLDQGDDLVWLYYPTSVILSFSAAQLPWSGGIVKEASDKSGVITADIIDGFPHIDIYNELHTKDSQMVPISWNDMSLHLPPDIKREDNLRYTPSKAIYTFTNGTIVPRNTRNIDAFEESLYDCGVTANEGKAIYGAYLSVLSNLEARVDFKDDTESLETKCKEYERELEKLRKENEQRKEELYKAEKALADKNTLLEKQTEKRSVEKQELNDLRELIFALTNDAGEERTSQKPSTAFPYHTKKKHVVFGGHPTWLKAIKPMLPDVKFIEGVPSSEQIKGAEMVWLQTNYMSHKAFYKIIDIVRSKNIPLRYFTSASASKGAEQVVVADGGK